ncbi:histone H2A-beta, sperm-like [Argiope bruennichi]|uniref:histone H2A-beta, sperm-like n=1 Tax=Argiope bruennichi TaxID=94029 RepID=UPI0024958265|nr:histone H2A-beta, sperm-like [Argiope bruennichi]
MPRTTKSQKCGLTFPVARIRAMLKAKNFANRVSDSGAVFLTAVLEYLTAEILEVSLNAAAQNGHPARRRIQPKDIERALKNDPEFLPLFRKAVFPGSIFVSSMEQNRARRTRQQENR